MTTASGVPATAAHPFLEAFKARHGRAPRILHVGNIANNAYLNAKFLNAAGYDCDVLCYDYYHLMGCPEWEDADFEGRIDDHFRPDWTKVDLKGFERPHWFIQGPQHLALDYVIARRSGQRGWADALWKDLAVSNGTSSTEFRRRTIGDQLRRFAGEWRSIVRIHFGTIVNRPDALALLWAKLHRWAEPRAWRGYLTVAMIAPFLLLPVAVIRAAVTSAQPDPCGRVWFRLGQWSGGNALLTMLFSVLAPFAMIGGLVTRAIAIVIARLTRDPAAARGQSLVAIGTPRVPVDPAAAARMWTNVFAQTFPERTDQMTVADSLQYMSALPKWRAALAQYDIVQAYATDVMYPLLCGKRPYLGFEHGTLRDFTLNDNAVSRLTALGYNHADRVFITNGDCLDYARRIHVTHVTPMVHPIDDQRIAAIAADYDGVHRQYGVRYIFLCPLRHDWSVKGTDQYIRALPLIADRIGRNFRVIMTEWGMQVNDSKALAASLGVDDLVQWLAPLARHELVRLQKSSDIVFDQIALPHFGATAPQAIAAGVPVIMSYDPSSTAWIVPEPAPILSAWTPPEIAAAVTQAIDPAWLADYRVRAQSWFSRFHSSRHVVEILSSAYEDVCRRQGLL
jgi:glycosyltransferase involved in cell wall biosynthesis